MATNNLTRYRSCCIYIVTVLVLSLAFSFSLKSVYDKLNDRITTLTTAEQINDRKHAQNEFNITVQLENMTDVSNELVAIKNSILHQKNQIYNLKNIVENQLSNTVEQLNNTVQKVQEDVNQQVQEVNDNVSSQNSLMAYQFAGTFAILGSLISFWHMMNHIRKLNEPMIQRKILAIMWMIPIYSISAWLGLVFVEAQAYLSLIKDLYEAYIIYTFLSFLIAVLARGNRNAVIDLLAQQADHLKPPIKFQFWRKKQTFATPRHKAEAVLDQCQIMCLQFVLIRPVTSISMIVCDAVHESSWDYRYPQFYIMWIVNISIFFAFTGLIRFYHVVKNDLNWMNPFAKFLCIKGVVFLTFWQGIVISFIANAVYKQTEVGDFNAMEWSKEAQSFLICLEMFMFAIAHCFVFPTDEWEAGYRERMKRRIKAKFGDNLALRDFVNDVKLVMMKKNNKNPNAGKKKKKKRRNAANEDSPDKGALMRSSSFDSENEDEDLDIDWGQGWSRIEQYIDIVDSGDGDELTDLRLQVDSGKADESDKDKSFVLA